MLHNKMIKFILLGIIFVVDTKSSQCIYYSLRHHTGKKS